MRAPSVLACLALAALVGGCGDTPTDPVPASPQLAKGGVANPGTVVTTRVTVTTPSQTIVRESGAPNSGNANQECRAGGALWKISPGTPQQIGTAPHAQCLTVVPGAELEILFEEIANYVLPTGGNYQLNFSPDPNDGITQRYVHYKKAGDYTEGTGVLYSVDPAGWTIDLGQPLVNQGGNLLENPATGIVVEACSVADPGTCGFGTLTW